MKTSEYIAWGAVIGMFVVMFTLRAVTRGPGSNAPGEATVSILGVVVDRVVIPPDADGSAGLPIDRIKRGLLVTMIGSAVASGCLGGLLGWIVGRSVNKQKYAEQTAAPDSAGI